MKKHFMAFMAMCAFLGAILFTSKSFAAPPFSGDSLDLGVSSVYEEPGTYPPVIHVYGGSTRSIVTSAVEFGVLTSSDNFASAASWQPLTGVVGYVAGAVNTAFVICPPGQTCGGYKAFYITSEGSGKLYRCTGLSAWKDLSGCSVFSIAGMTYDISVMGLSQDGNNLLVGGAKISDTNSQIYSIDIAAATATKLTACSDPAKSSTVTGSVVGSGVNQFLYVSYNGDHYRYSWTGTTCSGARQKIVGTMGWDNLVNPVDSNIWGAVGNMTGTFYFSHSDGTFFLSKKDLNCGDSFISLTEKCDPNAAVKLNMQTCSSIGMGFTGGSLGCNPGTCGWDTSACTSPTVCGDTICNGVETCSTCPGDCGKCCGNGKIDAGEVCDGTLFGGKTCASEKGTGYTGSLTCDGTCSTISTTGCVPPATSCGDTICNGTETCSTCPGDCGKCCGNGKIDAGEVCDGTLFGGKTCASEKGTGYTGSLTCDGTCSTISTTGCIPPAPSCGDTICNGTETCSTCPSDCGVCCGNGTIDAGEKCDGVALGGASCKSVLGPDYSGGLSCKSDCTFETSSCSAPLSCGNGTLDTGEMCDGVKFGTRTCETEKSEGYSGALSCTTKCVIDASGCTPPLWGIKVLSGDCKIVGVDPLNAAIQTVNGLCQFSFIPKKGVTANNFEVTAGSVKLIPFVVAELPARSAFTVPQGVVWKEVDSKGNKKQFGYGAGVVMGDEGTGFVFDTLSKYPIVSFDDTANTICFGRDKYENRMSEINVGNGVGCLAAGFHVEIDVEKKSVSKTPWKDGAGGDGGSGGDGGMDAGIGGSDAGTAGDAGAGGKDTGPPASPGGGDTGGCSCAIPGQEGFPFSGLVILALAMIAVSRHPRRLARSTFRNRK